MPRYLFALDVGSKKMTLAAAPVTGPGAVGPAVIETQPSRGIFKGVVNDVAALSTAIGSLLEKTERRIGARPTRLALSINGNYIEARHSVTAIALAERGTRSITRRDIETLNQQARSLGLELDEILLHEYPQGYSIDRHNMTLHPLSLHGRKFEMDLLLVAAKAGYTDNITKAVDQTGCDAGSLVYSGVAAGEAVLSREEKEKGVILVDIGEALTGILIYKDGIPRCVRVLSFGGKNLSEIIAAYCRVGLEAADEITRDSLEISSEIDEAQEFMIKVEEGFRPMKTRELAGVVAPEVDRFISMVRSVIFESGDPAVSGAKVVVTGGLSLLEGLLEKMERDIGLPVKIGIPKNAGDIPASQAPAYASALGLLHLQADIAVPSLLPQEQRNMIGRALDYVKHLYQDYF